ncbi:MAG: hypothetical protein KDE48_14865 [Anaerolineales bacterium]|nr:hypothetical protein [Anaerolineales bacterium]
MNIKKAYLGIKFYVDHRNRAKIEAISGTLAQVGYATTCITRDVEKWGQHKFSPQELMAHTFNVIAASDLAIIDLSEKGVGLGIEAGYAFARGIPLVTIAQANADISTTLRGISQSVFLYNHFDDLIPFWKTIN